MENMILFLHTCGFRCVTFLLFLFVLSVVSVIPFIGKSEAVIELCMSQCLNAKSRVVDIQMSILLAHKCLYFRLSDLAKRTTSTLMSLDVLTACQ